MLSKNEEEAGLYERKNKGLVVVCLCVSFIVPVMTNVLNGLT